MFAKILVRLQLAVLLAIVVSTFVALPALAEKKGYIETPDGIPLYYEMHGSGKTIVLIHGWTMNGEYWWQKNVPQLAKTHQVVWLDLRGHGLSGKTSTGHSIDQYAKDVRTLLEKLELKEVTLAGWSMGTSVILGYVEQFGTDRLRSVVFIDQSPLLISAPGWDHGAFGALTPGAVAGTFVSWRADRAKAAKGFTAAMFADPMPAAMIDEMYAESMKTPTEVALAVLPDLVYADFRPTVSKVTVPALLIYGRASKIFPTAVGEWLQANMPKARLVKFEKSAHVPFWEEPDKFNAELAAFVR